MNLVYLGIQPVIYIIFYPEFVILTGPKLRTDIKLNTQFDLVIKYSYNHI